MQMIMRYLLDASSSASSASKGGYTMPVVGIFVILILGLSGSLIPPLIAVYLPKFDLNNRGAFRFFNGLAAGVVLGVGYVHSIPDAIDSFEEALSGESGLTATYAWGGFLAMMGSLMTFIGEEFVHRRISRFAALHGHEHTHDHVHEHNHKHGHGHGHGHDHKHKHDHDHKKKKEEPKEEKKEEETKVEPNKDGYVSGESVGSGSESSDSARALEEGVISESSQTSLTPPPSPSCIRPELSAQASNTKDLDVVVAVAEEEDDAHKDEMTDTQIGYYTELYVLLFGLSFHSLFVGIALGVAGNDWGLMAAIIFHQFFEGLALGARVARANFKKKLHIWLLDFVYAIAVPVGISIGLGIQKALTNNDYAYNIANGVFQGLSGGILIYVALIHMMKEEMERPEFKRGGALLYLMYSGFFIGAGCMAVIGIWA